MNYPDSVQFLYALGNEIKTAKLGLERIATLLGRLGNPHPRGNFGHVAGTNGKGSTCAMVESSLRAAGMRTGLFTSPHLVEPTERIRISGQPLAPDDFARLFQTVHEAAEELLRLGELDLHPTYFETVTAMALVAFAESKVDMAVLEVGLGGRLDATNIVRPRIAVITPIDFDHEALLGKSLESIAGEKAGILKHGVPAVFARQRPEAQAVLDARARELGIAVERAACCRVDDLQLHAWGSAFTAAGKLRIVCPLPGAHQVENAVAAMLTLAALGIPDEAIQRGIAATRWPGRLERIAENPDVILDGAHNPAGARALADHMGRFFADREIWMIYGAMRDKAIAEMTAILFPRADHVIVTAPRQARAVRPETIAALADHPSMQIAPDLEAAVSLTRSASPEAVIFITGSLFLVGEAKALIQGSQLV